MPFPPPSYDTLFAGVPLKARSVVEGGDWRARRLPKIAENRTSRCVVQRSAGARFRASRRRMPSG